MAVPNKVFRGPRPRFKDNVNEGIRFPEVRVIFPDGTNKILPTSQAIKDAKALNLDLIVVSPGATPPVAKVIDEGKHAYEEKKKKQDAKRNQHVTVVKELKFSPNTDDHDYEFKKNHAIEFLKEGNKVRAVVRFRGREMAHTNLGHDLLNRLISDLAAYGKPESSPRQDGKMAIAIIAPSKG
jgi:translation initiation factor IF-3